MSIVTVQPRLSLQFQICSPKSPAASEQREKIAAIKTFWLKHWSQTFAATGAPEAGWKEHFDAQDIVVGLVCENKIVGCHLYTFYDLRAPDTRDNDYFGYFKDASIKAMLDRGVPRLMTMEYLGVAADYSHNAEKLSLGKLLVALATYAGNMAGADAVIGTPILTTKVAAMMDNVGALILEEKIPKYGYDLCLKYAVVSPWQACADQLIAKRADEIWLARDTLNEIPKFEKLKAA